MCLVAASWWSYWCDYVALTKEDLERVPERIALGLCPTRGWELSPADVNAAGAQGESPWVAPADAAAGAQGVPVGGGLDYGVGVGLGLGVGIGVSAANGNGVGRSLAQGATQGEEDVRGSCRERVVPTMLARRPHEIDNSSLQVKPLIDSSIMLLDLDLFCCCLYMIFASMNPTMTASHYHTAVVFTLRTSSP